MSRQSDIADVICPEPLRRAVLRSSVSPAGLLLALHRETARRGRLTTFGQPGLAAQLPGLPPVDLALRAGLIVGKIAPRTWHRIHFDQWDTIRHRGHLLEFVTKALEGRRIDTIMDDGLTSGAEYVISSAELSKAPPETVIRFRSPRTMLLSGGHVPPG